MKTRILLIMAIALTLLLASAWAADISGKWAAETQGRQGPQTTTFTFKVEGAKLTGTVSGRQGQPDSEISEGKIDGDNISFVVKRMGGPNQDMEMKTTYKGVVSGDEIKFTVERPAMAGMGGPGGGAPGGGPGGGAGMGAPAGGQGGPGGGQGGPRPPQELIAKRVK
jgi:hypothetical protein